jgi:hypothetical protein
MNVALLVAGAVAAATGVFHVYFGERHVFPPIRSGDLPATPLGDGVTTKTMLRGNWHFWAVSWLGAAALFFLLADGDLEGGGRTAVRVAAATFAVYAGVIGVAFRGRHPGWLLSAIVASAAWLATV